MQLPVTQASQTGGSEGEPPALGKFWNFCQKITNFALFGLHFSRF